jgi:hypothetical protein
MKVDKHTCHKVANLAERAMHVMLLKNVRPATVVLVSMILLCADGMFAQQSAPLGQADARPYGSNGVKKRKEPKDAGEPVKPKDKSALLQPEVLCERIQFAEPSLILSRTDFSNCEVASEKKKESWSTYGLSSVTVPPGGWKVGSWSQVGG